MALAAGVFERCTHREHGCSGLEFMRYSLAEQSVGLALALFFVRLLNKPLRGGARISTISIARPVVETLSVSARPDPA
jgi:hypothetical protein